MIVNMQCCNIFILWKWGLYILTVVHQLTRVPTYAISSNMTDLTGWICLFITPHLHNIKFPNIVCNIFYSVGLQNINLTCYIKLCNVKVNYYTFLIAAHLIKIKLFQQLVYTFQTILTEIRQKLKLLYFGDVCQHKIRLGYVGIWNWNLCF